MRAITIMLLLLAGFMPSAEAAEAHPSRALGNFRLDIAGPRSGLIAPAGRADQQDVMPSLASPPPSQAAPAQQHLTHRSATTPVPTARPMPCDALTGSAQLDCRRRQAQQKIRDQADMDEMSLLKIQESMDRKSKQENTMSSIVKKEQETQSGIVQNLK